MATTEIENRVSLLESEILTLKEKLAEIEQKPLNWWQKISETFANDTDYEEAMRLGREYRLAQKDEK
ncbi:MAG: hypothetical protein LUM44_16010 [Pyrinomonadaceae bacterium]|nr:hypothetical protein [Pyrinomonadaceae bacterium]